METAAGPLVDPNELCTAVEAVLRAHLPALAAAAGLAAVQGWDQVPSLDALADADLPAGAITCPGLSDAPKKRLTGYAATWRVEVGIYDRGDDYADTQRRVRRWAVLLTAVLLQRLGGLGEVEWVGLEIRDPGRESARTYGGCAVAIDVTPSALAVLHVPPPPDRPAATTVLSTSSVITAREG